MPKLADTVTGARIAGGRILQASRKHDPEGRMPLMDHIRELRNRLLKSALGLVLAWSSGSSSSTRSGSSSAARSARP